MLLRRILPISKRIYKEYVDVVGKVIDVIDKGLENKPDIDTASLTDYSQMKEKLAMEERIFHLLEI